MHRRMSCCFSSSLCPWSDKQCRCRPAVTISYAVGAAVAGLSALAFAELGTQYPLAGASYNYVLGTFGEFPAW